MTDDELIAEMANTVTEGQLTLTEEAATGIKVNPNPAGLIGIRGTLAIEQKPTGDGRLIKENAVVWEQGPWSLMARVENTGHDGAPLVGRIDTLERDGSKIRFVGVLDAQLGAQTADLVAKRILRGISLDPDSAEMELQTADGRPITEDSSEEDYKGAVRVFTNLRVRGGTILPMPAFVDTELELFELDAQVASAAPPAGNPNGLPAAWWFENPDLKKPTPLTITADGRVFGHIALWNTCHVGIQGACIRPPRSSSEYAYFASATIRTWCDSCHREEEMAVGPISAGVGHAGLTLTKEQTLAHYDDTRTGAADVAAGEDQFGIWVAGRVRPTATPEQVETLRASKVSGDWRRLNGNLELVMVLAVNSPGYPVPREKALAHVASGEVQTALISEPYGETNAVTAALQAKIDNLTETVASLLDDHVHRP